MQCKVRLDWKWKSFCSGTIISVIPETINLRNFRKQNEFYLNWKSSQEQVQPNCGIFPQKGVGLFNWAKNSWFSIEILWKKPFCVVRIVILFVLHFFYDKNLLQMLTLWYNAGEPYKFEFDCWNINSNRPFKPIMIVRLIAQLTKSFNSKTLRRKNALKY